jgi:hypothetical protein
MLKPISSPAPVAPKFHATAGRPTQESTATTARLDSQAHAAADEVRSGPPRTIESEELMGIMKINVAKQEAQSDALLLRGPGEIRRENGDVVTVEPPLRHTVKRPDGSTRQTDVGVKDVRLSETAPDGSSTVYYADGEGAMTIERRDAAGKVLESHRYGNDEPQPPVNVPPFGISGGVSGLGLRSDGTVIRRPEPQTGLRFSMGLSGVTVEIGG